MKVLISAFAFSPYRGSECAVGWNIVSELSKIHDVTVVFGDVWGHRLSLCDMNKFVTVNGGTIESRHGYEEIKTRGFTALYVGPDRLISAITRLHTLPGCWMLYYLAYNMWQKKAYRVASKLQSERQFDIVHQLNMIGYREPGYMWKLGIPFVWGPIGGAPNEPLTYRKMFSRSAWIRVALRTLLNEMQKRVCFRAKRAAYCAKKLWAVTDADYHMIHDLWGVSCDRMVEAGKVDAIVGSEKEYRGHVPLRIVWSGIHTPRKALPILLYAIAKMKDVNLHVDILGDGPETGNWKAIANKLAISSSLTWHGRLQRAQALNIMSKAHVLACPSIKEASSIVVIEALSLGLPVLCHDACGMGIVVTDKCGIKIPLKDPETSIVGFVKGIREFIKNPLLVEQKSKEALARAAELTWAAKAKQISDSYKAIVL